MVGIYKRELAGGRYLITPTLENARKLAEAGADLIAIEATFENRPDDRELKELLQGIRHGLGVPMMADVSVFEEGMRAWEMAPISSPLRSPGTRTRVRAQRSRISSWSVGLRRLGSA